MSEGEYWSFKKGEEKKKKRQRKLTGNICKHNFGSLCHIYRPGAKIVTMLSTAFYPLVWDPTPKFVQGWLVCQFEIKINFPITVIMFNWIRILDSSVLKAKTK